MGLSAAYLVPWATLRATYQACGSTRLPPVDLWGVGLWCAVAVPSLLQVVAPGLLEAGERDPDAIAAGEWWRLLTSMFLQDGGLTGTVFNLVTLAVSLVLVGTVVRGPRVVVLFVAGGVVANLLTVLTFGQSGAGNSMATIFLLVVATFEARPWSVRRDAGLAAVAALGLVAAALLVAGDQHGLAVAAGIVWQALPRRGSRGPLGDALLDRERTRPAKSA